MTTESTAPVATEATSTTVTESTAPKADNSSSKFGVDDFEQWLAKEETPTKSKTPENNEDNPFQEALKSMEKEDSTEKPETEPKKEEPARRTLKLKVNGEEVEYDATDESKLVRDLQKGFAADAKFQESARIQKQAEQFMQLLTTNPEAVLSHPALGINLREFAENYLYKQIETDRMSPEERQAKAEREELEVYRREKAEAQKRGEQERAEQLKEQYRQDYQQKFITAIEKTGMPKNDWTVKRMADYMREAIRRGHKEITPEDVAPMVKQDWMQAQRELFGSLDGDQLIEMVGKDTAEKIRKHQVAQVGKGNVFQAHQQQDTTPSKQGKKKPTTSSIYDFVDKVGRGY